MVIKGAEAVAQGRGEIAGIGFSVEFAAARRRAQAVGDFLALGGIEIGVADGLGHIVGYDPRLDLAGRRGLYGDGQAQSDDKAAQAKVKAVRHGDGVPILRKGASRRAAGLVNSA
ncbi:hypothetical protein [Caulobacter sp. LARHSG274]